MLRQVVKVEVQVREVIPSRFESGDSDNEGRNLVECASEACEQENSKFGLPNDPAT